MKTDFQVCISVPLRPDEKMSFKEDKRHIYCREQYLSLKLKYKIQPLPSWHLPAQSQQ